jgi:hypothetical protein
MLVLYRRIEARTERSRDVERPAGLDRAVRKGKRENFVARPIGAHDRRVEIKRSTLFIDHGRAGDAERHNIAAGERGALNGRSKRTLPDLLAALRVERENFVVLRDGDQFALARSMSTPQQRLRIDLVLHLSRSAGGARVGVDQQVLGRLSWSALLRRPAIYRRGREYRARPRLRAVSRRARQRPAAFRRR